MKLPKVGMNMQEATIARWHKQVGDTFRKGEPLYEFETEKVTQDVEAPGDGSLVEIRVTEGNDAQIGEVVCVVDLEMNSGS